MLMTMLFTLGAIALIARNQRARAFVFGS